MNCEKYLDLISARLDGQLTAQEEADLTTHLNECPACRAIANDLHALHSTLSQPGEVDAPPALSQTVMKRIKAERASARRRLVRRLSGLAACLLLCIGVLRVADATYYDHNRPTSDPHLPSTARHVQPLALAEELPFSNEQRLRLSAMATSFEPTADLLGNAEDFSQFLARFPYDDLSSVAAICDKDFFRSHRLLAVVLHEPSSSISHSISQLTDDCVTILRHVPEAGDSDMALWLILAQVDGPGPETALNVELLTN